MQYQATLRRSCGATFCEAKSCSLFDLLERHRCELRAFLTELIRDDGDVRMRETGQGFGDLLRRVVVEQGMPGPSVLTLGYEHGNLRITASKFFVHNFGERALDSAICTLDDV